MLYTFLGSCSDPKHLSVKALCHPGHVSLLALKQQAAGLLKVQFPAMSENSKHRDEFHFEKQTFIVISSFITAWKKWRDLYRTAQVWALF